MATGIGGAQTVPAPAALPATVLAALAKSGLPTDSLAVVVANPEPDGTLWLSHRATAPMNPASVIKLVTTQAALEQLGPGHTWSTLVYTEGTVQDGMLQGNLYLRGGGDPKLVSEKLWWLMQRVRGLGIQRIAGDIVLDRSAFDLPPSDPGAFDGEPLRPYNASPDALLVNFKTQVLAFVPDQAAGVARVHQLPPLAGVQMPASVPLADGPCGDWRATLNANFQDPLNPRFQGPYPQACGERNWPLAHPEPERFAARAVAGTWQATGGQLDGQVRDGSVPGTAALRLALDSPPLAEVVRDVNKFSNNVMAQHLLLALAQPVSAEPMASPMPPVTWAAARAALMAWWQARLGPEQAPPVVDNGSGLSRDTRITAQALARLLQLAYASPMMPELMASLPASGLDGTLRRSAMGTGLAHLKTGSLRDVQALAGYVHGRNGQRRVLVALVNHPNARAARPALDALVQWAAGL
jgi:D-alanyl-D-alanine carboxypeptidase/D-alanyl-D-alanine-endopeptidase (penicillin-binding protein 4)